MARRSWGAVRKLPSGRYQAKYRLEGVLTPAPETFPNRAQADRWLTNQRMEMERGENVDEKLGSRALGSWWPGYERSIARLRATTCNGYRAAWRLRIGPAFGSTAVRKIKATDVDEWLLRLREDGTSNGKIAEAYGVLNRLLDRAVRDKAIYRNPCRQRMEKLSRPKAIQRPVLTPIQVEQLVAPMATDLDRVCVRLMAYGGLRIGEMLGLHWDDVDFDRGTLTIRRSINDNSGKLVVELPKNGIVRTITLGETMTDQLRALKGTGKVYPSSRHSEAERLGLRLSEGAEDRALLNPHRFP